MMKGWVIALAFALLQVSDGWAQESAFPYPTIPDTIGDSQERVAYMLCHFWSGYEFDEVRGARCEVRDNLDEVRGARCEVRDNLNEVRVAEQGFADFVNLMQYADSATCAQASAIFVDSIVVDTLRLAYFDGLMDQYLANPESPLRNDEAYAHLLRALLQRCAPSCLPCCDTVATQRTVAWSFRLRQLEKNRVGMLATDFCFDDGQGRQQRLYDIDTPFTLIIFFDPECEHCQELLPEIKKQTAEAVHSGRLTTLFVNTELNPQAAEHYYLPSLPVLYLLDTQKRVLLRDATLDESTRTLHHFLYNEYKK